MSRNRRFRSISQLASLAATTGGLVLSSCQGSHEPAEPFDLLDEDLDEPAAEPLDERQRLAKSGQFLRDPSTVGTAAPATADEMVTAMDAAGIVADATLTGADVSTSVFDTWGVIRPRRGDSFAVISTGVIGTTPEPGTDMGSSGEGDDVVTLELELEIPEGFTRLSFDYDFLSAESPDYVGSAYNDTFTATLTDPDGVSYPVALASVNSSFFYPASAERAGGTTFDIFTLDPEGTDAVFTGGLPDAGITGFQPVSFAVPSAGSWTLTFEIRDLGDGIFDSAVIIDHLRLHAMEPLSLNPPTAVTDPVFVSSNGVIDEEPSRLALATQRMRGIAADGVTQVLLSTRVPGPGTMEYALEGGSFPADGGVSALNGTPAASVQVEAVEAAPGIYYAFATYTAPSDFERSAADDELASRTIELRASFTPDDPGDPSFVDIQPLELRRPPVVMVHGLWDEPGSWRLPLLDDPRLSVHHARHDGASHFAEVGDAIPTAILAARLVQHGDGIAGTQVDLVAHGTGGLLARQHVNASTYASTSNFHQGDVHKLITLNTPHLGAGFATAIYDWWASLPETRPATPTPDNPQRLNRQSLRIALSASGLDVESGAVEDMRVGSPFLAALGATDVPSHALTGSGGRDLERTHALGNNAVDTNKTVYQLVEQQHPATRLATQDVKLAFVFGNASQVFAGQHDLMSGVVSQEGGIDTDAVTTFLSSQTLGGLNGTTIVGSNYSSMQFPSARSNDYSARILELLGEPVDGEAFGPFPAPSTMGLMGSGSGPQPQEEPDPASSLPVAFSLAPYGLSMLSPVQGQEVVPGGTVEVSLTLDPGFGDLVFLGLVTPEATLVIDEPTFPFSLEMPVPEQASGSLEFMAFGITEAGDFVYTSVIDLGATPDASLLDVHIIDRNPFMFGVDDTTTVGVVGLYDDGIERNITSAAAGTEYLTSDPNVFTVSAEGVLTATGIGRTTLVARNGLLQDSVTVEVLPGLTATLDVTAAWPGGFCANIVATNHTPRATTDWAFTIDLGTATINESWNGVFSGASGTITVTPVHGWQLAIPGGSTADQTGFCASAPHGPLVPPTVVSVMASF